MFQITNSLQTGDFPFCKSAIAHLGKDVTEACKQLLLDRDINPVSSIEYEVNGTLHTLTLEWIIEAYMKTQKRDLFMALFTKAVEGSDQELETFFQQMGQLVLMSSLSEKSIQL